MISLVSVTVTSLVQLSELVIIDIEDTAPQLLCEFRSPWPMIGISEFVQSSRVVQDSKELYYLGISPCFFCQSQAVLKHTSPVRHAVIAAERQGVIFQYRFQYECDVHVHFGYFASADRLAEA